MQSMKDTMAGMARRPTGILCIHLCIDHKVIQNRFEKSNLRRAPGSPGTDLEAMVAPKSYSISSKSKFEEVLEALERGLGAMLAFRQAVEIQKAPKTHSAATLVVMETSGSKVSMH